MTDKTRLLCDQVEAIRERYSQVPETNKFHQRLSEMIVSKSNEVNLSALECRKSLKLLTNPLTRKTA